MPTTAESNFFQKRHATSVAYLVGLLLFFLPFVEIKCNNVPFAQNTGLGLAFGTDYKVTGQMGSLQDLGNRSGETKPSQEKGKMYVLALVALVLGVIGLFVSLSNGTLRSTIGMLIGPIAAICLVIVMIQINGDVKSESKSPDKMDGFSNAVNVTVDFTFWFYLSVCSFLAAAFLGYKQRQLGIIPPASSKPAIQTHAENTAGQSDPQKTASEPEAG